VDADIVDLADIAAACGPLADWWDTFVATGESRLPELEQARRSVRRLAGIPGSIGRAARQLDAIGDEPEPVALVGAVDLLCKLARHNMHVQKQTRPSPSPERRSRARPGATDPAQLLLPGLEQP